MKDSALNIVVPKKENGAIDIDSIVDKYFRGYWNDSFLETNNLYYSKSREAFKDYFIENAEDIIDALNLWLSPTDKIDIDKREERRLNNILVDYIYAGNVSLRLNKDIDKSKPLGLSSVIVSNIKARRTLRSLYYYYVKITPDSSFSSVEKLYDFANIIIENLRAMFLDIWNYDFFREKLKDDASKYDLIKIIESNFCDYLKLCSPLRCLRIVNMLNEQSALPCVKNVKERQHLLNCFIEKSVKLKGANMISSFIEELFPHWENHIEFDNLIKENDASRFNDLMSDIIDNITFGDLKEAETQKNRESGEKARKLRDSLKKCEIMLQSKDMSVIEYKSLLSKRESILSKLTMLNGQSLALSDDNVGAVKLEVPYCADDYSEEIWAELSDDYKLYLLTIEFCDRLKIKTGYKGILQKMLNVHISCIPSNISRMILSKILNRKLEEVTVANKNILREETESLMRNPAYSADVSYTLSRIMDNKIRKVLKTGDIDSNMENLLDIVCQILKELKTKGLN